MLLLFRVYKFVGRLNIGTFTVIAWKQDCGIVIVSGDAAQ